MSNDFPPNPAPLPGAHSNEGVFRATDTDGSYTSAATTGWTPPLTAVEIIELRVMLAEERRQKASITINKQYIANTAAINAMAAEATRPHRTRRDEALAALWGDDDD